MDQKLLAIGRATAVALREDGYHDMDLADIGRRINLTRVGPGRPADGNSRSHAWVRRHIGSKSCAALLAGWTAWQEHLTGADGAKQSSQVSSISESENLLTAAIHQLLCFLGEERALFREILLSVPDARLDRSGMLAQNEALERIITAAQSGTCGVFADWLVPVVGLAHSPVHALPEGDLLQDANLLSELVVRMAVQNAVPVQARALWSFWFQQCVVGRAGPAAEQRERAEHEVETRTRPASAKARVGRSMLAGAQDLRAIGVFADDAKEAARAGRYADSCDSYSRAGLAALRAGVWPRATELLVQSEETARRWLRDGNLQIARALSNRAEVSARSGRPDLALGEIKQALLLRASDRGPANARRRRISEWVRVTVLAEHGHVGTAADLAARLSADGAEGQAEELVRHARVLRQAGRPQAALTVLDLAEPGTASLESMVERARCELMLPQQTGLPALLAHHRANWLWYAERVSARLTFELLIQDALANASVEALREARQAARAWTGFAEDDELFDAFGWAMAQLLRGRGELGEATAELITVRDSQTRRIAANRLFAWHPWVATTRLELAECAEAGNASAADPGLEYAWIIDNRALDPVHPLRVAAVLGLVRLARKRGAHGAALRLLATLPSAAAWPLDQDVELTWEATRLRRLYGRALS